MTRRDVHAPVDGGKLVGWVQGSGTPVLLLHGGPGLNYDYLDGVADDIGGGYELASYQQRGLRPSVESGPFDIATHVDDVRRVLDALGWDRAYVLGHSWGGHLAMHVALALAPRLQGVLVVDPLGAVGDGGEKEFEAEMMARTPADVRALAEELDARAQRGEGTEGDAIEGMRLVWPAYFAQWDAAPAMPPLRISVPCYAETFDSIHRELPALASALPSIRVPVGFVAGASSPMPTTSSTEAAALIPGAWADIVNGAGHFPWIESPGCIRSALDRLAGG
jgi:pimeloyl-ACP methyl ester carboxylesterase